MQAFWKPGEEGAKERLEAFLPKAGRYQEKRNLPSIPGTSFLSPHLHFGEVSPARLWHAAMDAGGSVETYLKELVWRDYAANIILQFPDYGARNARGSFDHFPWRNMSDENVRRDFRLWTKGQTGYPIVDAGMRELWATGWMHNRVRMIAASFLIKHLLIDWVEGEKWFWDTLVDADYASNAVNWQWTAGSGVDSNMFVRIMAPLSQSENSMPVPISGNGYPNWPIFRTHISMIRKNSECGQPLILQRSLAIKPRATCVGGLCDDQGKRISRQ